MKQIIYVLLILTLILSCKKSNEISKDDIKSINNKIDSIKMQEIQDNELKEVEVVDEIQAKEWLETSIKNCYKNFNGDISKICTKRCFEYLQDAIGTVYAPDSGACGEKPCLTEQEFKKKWSGIYDTSKAIISDADVLSCSQDPFNITAKAEFLKKIDENTFLFKVETLYDGKFNNCFRNIKVIKNNSSFLIDEINL